MKKKIILIIGLCFILCGMIILGIFGYKRISSELSKQKLMETSVILEIPSIDVCVPVVEGTNGENLHIAAGHFENTGAVGSGNYCIAGHNSTIYAEIFNDLDQIQIGDEMYLFDNDTEKTKYTYIVTEYNIVDSHDIEVLDDYGDNRLTVISCTDDGEYRQVVVGMLK